LSKGDSREFLELGTPLILRRVYDQTPSSDFSLNPLETATIDHHAESMRTGGCLEFGEAPL
jgi:hypothetical protein